MSWSTTPPAPIIKPGWTTDPTIVILPPGQQKWGVKYSRTAMDGGVGSDLSAILPRIPAVDTGLGADIPLLQAIAGLLVTDDGLGTDAGLLVPELLVIDSGLGADLARPGVRGWDSGVGNDFASLGLLPLFVSDSGAGADRCSDVPRIKAFDGGLGADTVTNGFATHAAVTTPYTLAGTYTYTIPVWCRYIDVVLVGAGGGGASSGTFYTLGGYPGQAGSWATLTLQRGVDIPWTATSITVVVGVGGNKGVGGFTGTSGTDGAASTLVISGSTVLTAAGGTRGGVSATGTSDNTGRSPGSITYNGEPYTGGATQPTTGANGNPPGGGGAGGKNFGGSGGNGAPGGGWCRAYQ